MAKFAKAWKNRSEMMALLVQRAREADAASVREHRAALQIQSWFRGCRVRAYLAYLHDCAKVIQRNFRGHLGREDYRQRLEKSLDDMRIGYYKKMATKIQRLWRGYYVRKFVFDYRAYKEYLEAVQIINAITRARIKEESERVKREKEQREVVTQELREQNLARRQHYLLGTEMMEGIFKKAGSGSKPHPFEEKMRSIQFTPLNFPHKTSKAALTGRWKTKTKSPEYDPQPSAPPLEHPPSPEPYLPPLQKIQGPFKHPEELRRLKSKPTRPTLRMETPYYSQDMRRIELKDEEWRKRVVDDNFLPFARRSLPPYQPLLHTSSSYHSNVTAKCTSRYRRPEPAENISTVPFRTIMRPLATFDDLRSSF